MYHRDRVAVLETEGEKLSNLVEKEKQQIDTLEQIIAVIDRCAPSFVSYPLDLALPDVLLKLNIY